MNKPTIYLSGPISNIKDGNEPYFRHWEKKVTAMGYHAIVPHDLKPELDYSLQEKLSAEDWKAYEWRMYMDLCIPEVVKAQAVCTLDGWFQYSGANVEVKLARGLNIPVFYCVALPTPELLVKNLADLNFKHKAGLLC